MNNKEKFISEIENILINGITLSTEAMTFFNELKILKASKAVDITENGRKILTFMKENKDSYNNIFKAKEIAEGLFMPPKSVSGSMRKLVTDGYVNKIGQDPVCYSLSDKGFDKEIPSFDE